MDLQKYGEESWRVLMVMRGDEVPVLEVLATEPRESAHKMIKLLDMVKCQGPPKNPEKCKKLRDDIFELKAGGKKGPKLRILFFYDKNNVIVCTNAFPKDQKQTNPVEIGRAVALRRQYFIDKKKSKIRIRDGRV